jgi:hypothetical protein
MKSYKRSLALSLGLIVLALSFPNISKADSYEKKAGTIAADVFVWRPAGVVLTAGGSVLYALIFPATLISGGTKDTANTLVKTPFKFTFCRPIGTDLRDYVDEY